MIHSLKMKENLMRWIVHCTAIEIGIAQHSALDFSSNIGRLIAGKCD